jgi:antitoxin component YwqK of YwqJK toxin-antitoxin module
MHDRLLGIITVGLMLALLLGLPATQARAESEGDSDGLQEQTIVLEPGQNIESDSGRVSRRVEQYQRGFKVNDRPLRVEIGIGVEAGGGGMIQFARSIVTLDEKGRPHGKELRYLSPRWNERERLVPWVHGVKHGEELEYSGWGNKVVVSTRFPWKQGEMTGTRRKFYQSGELLSETPYIKGEPHGKSRSYDREGRLLSEAIYVNGRMHGKKIDYWPETGEPRRIIPYREGLAHGQMQAYHLNGQLKRQVACRTGMLHGEEVVYNDEGKLLERRFWLDGDPVSRAEFEVAQRQADDANEG